MEEEGTTVDSIYIEARAENADSREVEWTYSIHLAESANLTKKRTTVIGR